MRFRLSQIFAAAILIGMVVLIAIYAQPPQVVVVPMGPPCRTAHVTMGIDDPLHQADRFQPLPCRRATLPGTFADDGRD